MNQHYSSYLFIYGTLMQNISSNIARYLKANSRLVGNGQMQGKLYDLGQYPGAVYSSKAKSWIKGQVIELEETASMLSRLDDYEGEEYDRKVVPIHLSNEVYCCWVYLYRFNIDGFIEIEIGDYLNYSQHNHQHQDFIRSV